MSARTEVLRRHAAELARILGDPPHTDTASAEDGWERILELLLQLPARTRIEMVADTIRAEQQASLYDQMLLAELNRTLTGSDRRRRGRSYLDGT